MQRRIDLDRVNSIMDREHLDALVALTPEDVFYLSEMPCSFIAANRLLYSVRQTSPCFCVVPRKADAKLILTSAATEVAKKHSWITDLQPYVTGTYISRPTPITELGKDGLEVLSKTIKNVGDVRRIGVDTKYSYDFFVERLTKSLEGIEIVEATPIFDELRMIKTPEELRRFREADRILCKALRGVIREMKPGVTERHLENSLKNRVLKEGASSWQQTTFAAGSVNGPDIYNQASERKIKNGDIIRFDIGCVYQGYTADLSRTIGVGKIPPEAVKIHDVLKRGEDAIIERLKLGTKASELHRAAVEYVRKELDPGYKRGNVGHGVGIELYDHPVLSEDDHTPLAPGMTFSIEVPYHKIGLGGLNIEDSVLVTQKGCEIITDLPRKLIRV